MTILYLLFMAVCNRARGTGLFINCPTTIGRIVSMGLMACATTLWHPSIILLLWLWIALFFWCVFPWDADWSACIGNDPVHTRLWGLWHMAIRMTLAILPIGGYAIITGGNYWWALATPLLGLPYYVFGYLTPGSTSIRNAELAVGAMMGAIFLLV